MYKYLLFVFGLLSASLSWSAKAPSINELNSCLALVDFVDIKLDEFADHYSANDMFVVHKGLAAYSQFLQQEVITPKLVGMYGGNHTQAKLMQKLFDRQRKSFLQSLNDRYSEQKLLTEYAASINDCRAKTRIKADTAKALDRAITAMIRMARA